MSEVLLLTGYRAEQIHDYFARHPIEGIEVSYSRELAPLGTGGAVRQAVPQLASRFVLINGDTYLDMDYAALLERAERKDALATMVIYRDTNEELDQAGNVEVDDSGFLVCYQKAGAGQPLPYIDAGVSVWSRQVFEDLSARTGAFSLEQDVLPELIARRQLWSWPSATRYYDIGTPDRLATFEAALPR
jgi:NDP-sugar pyrophosphorylase family protein